MTTKADIRIGISGWRYAPWRGVFYPKDLAQRRELEFASTSMSSIEINGSFYALQTPASYQRWYDETPAGFIFSVKAPRYITHILRLKDAQPALANFLASGLFRLREKLGPILWQFPPSMRFEHSRFEEFLKMLPHDTGSALKLARRREPRLKGRSALAIDQSRRLRHAVEIRHGSFCDPSFIKLLRQHGVALVVADTAGKWPYLEELTADFVYIRLHGDKKLYVSGYTEKGLKRWRNRIQRWAAGKEPTDAVHVSGAGQPPTARSRNVYCYFDNDAKIKAPRDALKLRELLGLRWDPQPRGNTKA